MLDPEPRSTSRVVVLRSEDYAASDVATPEPLRVVDGDVFVGRTTGVSGWGRTAEGLGGWTAGSPGGGLQGLWGCWPRGSGG